MRKILEEGSIGFTTEDTECRYKEENSVVKNRPNVVYIVLDDLGFAQLGCYGSNIHTPNIDRLASEGLRYNNFHTTAICSATRASLLTGVNHHAAGVNATMEFMTGHNNGVGHLHRDCATLAEILKEYGYATIAAGKWHLTDITETTEAGPFDNWPLGKGFDQYYGFLQAQMDQYHPRLIRDNSPVPQPKSPEEGYHFSEDITDEAIRYIFHQKAVYPEKPFFLYLAYGAMHAPHHAPASYIEKYKGAFDEGWDVFRKKWFQRQKQLGIIPENAELTPRNELVKPWDALTENEKKIAARYMEVYAGMLEHTDAQIGKLIDYLRDIDELDNTVIVFLSDNGASAEGGALGSFNNYGGGNDEQYVLEHLEEIGSPASYNHYPMGWANAGNTPFPWYKMFTYSGGVKDAMIVRYPGLIQDAGAVRSQYHHVSDITPTILDILGVEKPEYIKGVKQKAFTGISFKYTLTDGQAKDRKHVQYYEMFGNRAIYKDGWKAIVNHSRNQSGGDFKDDVWELYHVAEDYSENRNVAEQYPEKVKELEKVWMIEAASNGVFPMLNGAMYGSKEQMVNLMQHIVKNERFEVYRNIMEPVDILRGFFTGLNNKSHVIIAELDRESTENQGVIFSFGGYYAGYSLYIHGNKLKYVYSFGGSEFYIAESAGELPSGKVHVEYRFKMHKDYTAFTELFVNGEKVGEVMVPHLNPNSDPIATIGANKYTSVYPEDYEVPFVFDGKLEEVKIYVEGYSTTLSQELEAFFATD